MIVVDGCTAGVNVTAVGDAVVDGTGIATTGGVTTICVEPWIREAAASAVPTTTPSTTASGNVMIAPAADARSVKMPGRWIKMFS